MFTCFVSQINGDSSKSDDVSFADYSKAQDLILTDDGGGGEIIEEGEREKIADPEGRTFGIVAGDN